MAARVGVLALQGGFAAHINYLERLGTDPVEVRRPSDLSDLDGLVIPGGESTTISLGIEREGLVDPIREFARSGRQILGTCAGMIVLDSAHLGLLEITCARNAFGRQAHSFEADLRVKGVSGNPLRAVFIRAPWVAECGKGVEVIAEVDGHVVGVRQGSITAVAFHPELTDDLRLHRLFLEMTA